MIKFNGRKQSDDYRYEQAQRHTQNLKGKKIRGKVKKKRQKKEISIDLEATGQIRQRYTIDRETKKQKKKLHHTILREREEQTIKINDLRKKY